MSSNNACGDISRAGIINHSMALLRALLECGYYSREGLIWGNTVVGLEATFNGTWILPFGPFRYLREVIGKCAIYGQMWHLWANVPFLGKCDIYGQMCHLWANVTFMGKCDIYGQMCHFWANVTFLGKCDIIGQMWHFLANVTFMGKCAIYGQISEQLIRDIFFLKTLSRPR